MSTFTSEALLDKFFQVITLFVISLISVIITWPTHTDRVSRNLIGSKPVCKSPYSPGKFYTSTGCPAPMFPESVYQGVERLWHIIIYLSFLNWDWLLIREVQWFYWTQKLLVPVEKFTVRMPMVRLELATPGLQTQCSSSTGTRSFCVQ